MLSTDTGSTQRRLVSGASPSPCIASVIRHDQLSKRTLGFQLSFITREMEYACSPRWE